MRTRLDRRQFLALSAKAAVAAASLSARPLRAVSGGGWAGYEDAIAIGGPIRTASGSV